MTIIAQTGTSISEQQLRESLAVIAKAADPKGQRELTELSRVNEQDVFAALIHGQLENESRELSKKFEEKFQALVQENSDKHSGHAVFEAARMALRRLRLAGEVSRELAVKIRHFALGKAQLDSKRDELSTKNITGKAGDTALRTVQTAIKMFSVNEAASTQEMDSFKAINSTRRAQTT